MDENKDFTLNYNGRKTECRSLGDHSFMVQITYKPVYLSWHLDDDGIEHWIEKESNKETSLSQELGKLIRDQYKHLH
jgi:hypothetical protein